MFTHKQYMAYEVSHQEYYGQFGKKLVNLVRNTFGEDTIKNSTDKYFNDIPLKQWNNLQHAVMCIVGREIAKANGTCGVSLSNCVCALKAAARIIRDS